jgi:hypothetical protein
MGKSPPSMHFSIRMIPPVNFREQCIRVRIDELSVCYALPFPRVAEPLVWNEAMVDAFSFLAHEIAIAVCDRSNFPSMAYREVLEAQATLFNQYAAFRFANTVERQFPHFKMVLLPPLYRVSKRREHKMSSADWAGNVGAQLGGHALREALGGERAICPGDRQVENRTRKLIRRVFHDTAILRRYLKRERQRMHEDFPGSVLRVITPRDTRQDVPVRLLDSTWKPDHFIVGGIIDIWPPSMWPYVRKEAGSAVFPPLCSNRALATGS